MRLLLSLLLLSCTTAPVSNTQKQTDLSNAQMKNYSVLECMYEDEYFPPQLVDKCKAVLVDLCFRIEKEQPQSVEAL
ncbi:MAG: DUF5713 family protein [Flavobacteriales bacterium]